MSACGHGGDLLTDTALSAIQADPGWMIAILAKVGGADLQETLSLPQHK